MAINIKTYHDYCHQYSTIFVNQTLSGSYSPLASTHFQVDKFHLLHLDFAVFCCQTTTEIYTVGHNFFEKKNNEIHNTQKSGQCTFQNDSLLVGLSLISMSQQLISQYVLCRDDYRHGPGLKHQTAVGQKVRRASDLQNICFSNQQSQEFLYGTYGEPGKMWDQHRKLSSLVSCLENSVPPFNVKHHTPFLEFTADK